MDEQQDAYAWATRACEKSGALATADLLEELMAAPECDAFGPVHHYLVGAALLTCVSQRARRGGPRRPARRAPGALGGGAGRDVRALGRVRRRGVVRHGARDSGWRTPRFRAEGWSECQLMVSDLLRAIAEAGAPRCCKRDARIAVRGAVSWFERLLGVDLAPAASEAALRGLRSQQRVPRGRVPLLRWRVSPRATPSRPPRGSAHGTRA